MTKLQDFTKRDRYKLGVESPDQSSYWHIENENLELEVEPEEVNLSSFKVKKELEPKIWSDDRVLDSKVRLALMDIADDFWESCKISWVKPEDVILTGSICNYNWSKYSDVDLHLVVDFDKVHKRKDFVKEYFDEKKNDWNNTHENLKVFGFPVELYVQDTNDETTSGGIYDLYNNKWIRKPEKNKFKLPEEDKEKIRQVASKLMTKIDDLEEEFNNEADKHKIEVISNKLDNLSKKIKNLRTLSLEKDGEMGVGNICYKVLRRTGYLDRMWELMTKCYDKINSVDE